MTVKTTLLTGLIAAGSVVVSIPALAGNQRGTVVEDNVGVHKAPSEEAREFVRLYATREVTVRETRNGWARVSFRIQKGNDSIPMDGWIDGRYVQLAGGEMVSTEPAPAASSDGDWGTTDSSGSDWGSTDSGSTEAAASTDMSSDSSSSSDWGSDWGASSDSGDDWAASDDSGGAANDDANLWSSEPSSSDSAMPWEDDSSSSSSTAESSDDPFGGSDAGSDPFGSDDSGSDDWGGDDSGSDW